LCKCQV